MEGSTRPRDRVERRRQALLEAARAGSREAKGALLNSYWSTLCRYFARRLPLGLRAKIAAEDLTQTAFVSALRAFDNFHGDIAAFGAWLIRICQNLLKAIGRYFGADTKRDVRREDLLDELAAQAGREHAHDHRQPTPDEVAAAVETAGQVQSALGRLPADQREVVTMYYQARFTFVEIASQLRLSPDAVKRVHKHGLITLRVVLD